MRPVLKSLGSGDRNGPDKKGILLQLFPPWEHTVFSSTVISPRAVQLLFPLQSREGVSLGETDAKSFRVVATVDSFSSSVLPIFSSMFGRFCTIKGYVGVLTVSVERKICSNGEMIAPMRCKKIAQTRNGEL